jgi:hypothetical protein
MHISAQLKSVLSLPQWGKVNSAYYGNKRASNLMAQAVILSTGGKIGYPSGNI